MSVIAVVSDPGVGGHFLNWSILYLTGQTTYYYADKSQLLDVPANPVTKINAHGFIANQPETLEEFNSTLNKLTSTNTNSFHTIYFHNFKDSTPDNDTGTVTAIQQLASLNNTKIILLSTQTKHVLYNCKYTKRSLKSTEDTDKYHSEFIDLFFKESKQIWDNLELKEIWDQREFLALNLQPFKVPRIQSLATDISGYYLLDTFDLFACFDVTVSKLLEFLELPLDSTRWDSWIQVYNQWQTLHKERLLFTWYYNIIIDAILAGQDLDLTRFNLDIIQEAAIQHTLLYTHSLNLKTWQLTKFTNTRQLHNLLEPNTHTLIC